MKKIIVSLLFLLALPSESRHWRGRRRHYRRHHPHYGYGYYDYYGPNRCYDPYYGDWYPCGHGTYRPHPAEPLFGLFGWALHEAAHDDD